MLRILELPQLYRLHEKSDAPVIDSDHLGLEDFDTVSIFIKDPYVYQVVCPNRSSYSGLYIGTSWLQVLCAEPDI